VGSGAAGTGPRGAGGVGTTGAPSGEGIEGGGWGGEAEGWLWCRSARDLAGFGFSLHLPVRTGGDR
jgi:hypothetical protein